MRRVLCIYIWALRSGRDPVIASSCVWCTQYLHARARSLPRRSPGETRKTTMQGTRSGQRGTRPRVIVHKYVLSQWPSPPCPSKACPVCHGAWAVRRAAAGLPDRKMWWSRVDGDERCRWPCRCRRRRERRSCRLRGRRTMTAWTQFLDVGGDGRSGCSGRRRPLTAEMLAVPTKVVMSAS